ncbi:DUF885 domain-containing protein [Undibacterium seohonense]|uniref:DUF885 domain-containing protein n=1 Tax=Undibacterium seohonense TaxID=1344950 RepID=A0ABR6X1Z7_9BURK|nr:DUF885 domain-containing protein [Undibacterium seohonense]MBC3806865.1 DUF885 domain-containing protein [Undibacterium seohonense]
MPHSLQSKIFAIEASTKPKATLTAIALATCVIAGTPTTIYAMPTQMASLSANSNSSEKTKAEQLFKELYQKEAAFRNKEFPGRRAADDEDEITQADYSDAAEQRRLKTWRDLAQQLQNINPSHLSKESQINLKIFADQITNRINSTTLNAHLLTFNSDSQFWAGTAGAAESTRCANFKGCERYLKQLNSIPQTFAQKIALMKLGIDRGMTMPQVVLTGRDASIQRHVVAQVEESVFYKAFTQLPASINPAQQADLQKRAKKLISERVIPAYQELLDFIRNDYMPKARQSIAAYDLPNGKAFYQAQIFEYTTLSNSPEEIHAIGLSEVARIRNEMNTIITGLKFNGDFKAFLHFLRTDPQFYAKTPRELLAEASYWAKKSDGLLIRYFGQLPRKPYGIQAVPEDIAPTYTAGRYAGSGDPKRPSNYWVNTSLLNQRPMWALPALTLHEAVPGHHLQIALAGEQAEQPEFRRNAYISAFGEGWALYAEHLGVEMGFYETPYHHFGRLVYEMWRASRLVVDTGMHAKGWSRDRALEFMRENTALSEHEITTEIDRYISWPGQALAYKLGELKIREVRQKTEKILEDRFDLKTFHDKLLSLGSVPLSILESEMIDWANQIKKSKK